MKVISIKRQHPENMHITMQLTTWCPYECSYCPDNLHKGFHQVFDIDELESFFNKFADRRIILTLTGGEATTHPRFVEVLQLAKKLNINTLVDTNFVRPKRFYDSIGDLVGTWNVTLHPSQHKLDLPKLEEMIKSSFVVVYVMMDSRYWEKSVDWWNQVIQLSNIKAIPLKTISNYGGADFTAVYTDEQLKWFENNPSQMLLTKERWEVLRQTHSWLMTTESDITYDDGRVEQLDSYVLIKQGLNDFYGWKCFAGREDIAIRSDGSATWANCGIKTYDSYLEITPEELQTPMICNSHFCTCGTDIRTTKYAG